MLECEEGRQILAEKPMINTEYGLFLRHYFTPSHSSRFSKHDEICVCFRFLYRILRFFRTVDFAALRKLPTGISKPRCIVDSTITTEPTPQNQEERGETNTAILTFVCFFVCFA